jgi:hypothetical protein
MVRISRRRERGAPVYVDTGEGVLSLVYEVAVTGARRGAGASGARLSMTAPLQVHVIDDTGVQVVGFRGDRPLFAIGAAFLLGPLQWVLFGRRRHKHG